ncbi:MAG TPA: methylated-DNA--[protein]-cysteine S-methyltransferase [Gemmatimonadales bacterium]|nr:methylated-DNA--[protein]-cysteine S-methyltransferase [Gemmatimonadales bacterium]
MKARDRFEERAALRMVRAAFRNLTGRDGAVLNYAMMSDTPVGTLGIAAGPAGLCRVSFVKGEDDFLAELLEAFGQRPVVRSSRLDEARRALDRYFSGRRLDFADLAVDLSELSPFERRVLGATARIPPGRVATYAEVARRAGNERASRAAGNALHKNPVAIVVPCHRVLRADGSLGGYGGGLPIKEWLLKHEGARG